MKTVFIIVISLCCLTLFTKRGFPEGLNKTFTIYLDFRAACKDCAREKRQTIRPTFGG